MDAPHHQEVLRCLFRESNDAFFLFDPESLVVLDLNPAALRLTGLDRKTALRSRVTELFSSDDPVGVESLIDAYRNTGVFHSREGYYFKRPGSTPLAINVSASRIHTTPKSIGLVVVRDISERRKAQEVLERFFQFSPALFAILDDDGRFLKVNAAWPETMGYSEEELRSVEAMALVPPEDREAARLDHVEPGPQGPTTREIRFRHKDGGDRWLAWSSARGDGFNYAVAFDVTGMKEAEALRRAKESAEAASRVKGQFLSSMSHELRTPLTAILALVDVLIADPSFRRISEDRAMDLLTIRRNGDYLLQLINNVLDLAKIEGGTLTAARSPCDVAEIIAGVAELLKVRADAKGLTLTVVPPATPPPTIMTDPTRLRQILINLVGNAIKFTENGGIRIEVGAGANSSLYLDVTDTGAGLSDEEIAGLFQPFRQVRDSQGKSPAGTGLGLAISRRLAETLSGTISVVRSKRGIGSTFRLSIPVQDPDREAWAVGAAVATRTPPIPPAAAETRRTRMRRILLAEDNPDNRRAVKLRLEMGGLEVSTAQNGQEAYEIALRSNADGLAFDVILMDMQMPILDGFEATRQLRMKGYEGPIVALTAFAFEEDREECIRYGCNDHVGKPIDWDHLFSLIDRLS
ncbi:PAS domain S-box protein [Isosphaeraceae bacterium EP7]